MPGNDIVLQALYSYCSVIVVASSVYVRLVPVRSKVRSQAHAGADHREHHDLPHPALVQVGGPHVLMVQDGLAVRKAVKP